MDKNVEPYEEMVSFALEQLTPEEKEHAVVYALKERAAAGTTLEFPRVSINVEEDSFVVFVDRQPMANWSHSARYIVLNPRTHQAQSFEARLPPFQPNEAGRWRVIYQAPSVPESFLALPFDQSEPGKPQGIN